MLDQPVGEVDVEQKLEADAGVAPARAAEDGEVVQDDVVRLGSVLEELVVRPDEVPAVAVHLTRVHLPRGLPLQQAELVVLDVRKTQGEEDDREEHPDEAQQHARGHVVGPVHDVAVRAPEFVERHAARRRRRRRRGRGGYADAPGSGLTRMSGRSGRPGSGPSQTSIEKGSFQSPPGSFESTTGREEGGGGYADPARERRERRGAPGRDRARSNRSLGRGWRSRETMMTVEAPSAACEVRCGGGVGVAASDEHLRLAFVGHVRRSIDESSRPFQISEPRSSKVTTWLSNRVE